MTSGAILVLLFLNPGILGQAGPDQSVPAQTQPAQNTQQSTSPSTPAKPASGHPAHRKETKTADCSSSTSYNSADAKSGTANSASAQKPCPPKKVVVKNGGSDQPPVELKGDTPPAKASNDLLNTEQLHLATEDNLKKIAGRQLTANQQEMVNQIKQFMDQSKAAVADGDLERGHNLAMKARLLSDELIGP